jgi:hypothetical protein
MLVIEGVDFHRQLSREEWEQILNERYKNKFIMVPDGSLVKPERIGVEPSRSNPERDYTVNLVTGSHVLHYSLEEFLSYFNELPKH